MSGHAPADADRSGCSLTVHACLDLLDAARETWMRRADASIETDIELFTAAPDTRAADLVHGAALMLFLAERRSAGVAVAVGDDGLAVDGSYALALAQVEALLAVIAPFAAVAGYDNFDATDGFAVVHVGKAGTTIGEPDFTGADLAAARAVAGVVTKGNG